MYAALRDTESALALSPSYQKALRRRLRCLQHLNWNKVANHLLQRYSEQFPNDSDFIGRTKDDLELALKTESGTLIICLITCEHVCADGACVCRVHVLLMWLWNRALKGMQSHTLHECTYDVCVFLCRTVCVCVCVACNGLCLCICVLTDLRIHVQ